MFLGPDLDLPSFLTGSCISYIKYALACCEIAAHTVSHILQQTREKPETKGSPRSDTVSLKPLQIPQRNLMLWFHTFSGYIYNVAR
jgi:hypothetical protein